jgi:restriction system protein
LTGLFGLSDFVARAEPELAANAILCAVNQAAYLLTRQLESQGGEFLAKGGFTEKLYGARKRRRISEPNDRPGDTTPPACPNCGKPMKLRTVRAGPKSGARFWGCPAYPDCRGTLPLGLEAGSDRSDK